MYVRIAIIALPPHPEQAVPNTSFLYPYHTPDVERTPTLTQDIQERAWIHFLLLIMPTAPVFLAVVSRTTILTLL